MRLMYEVRDLLVRIIVSRTYPNKFYPKFVSQIFASVCHLEEGKFLKVTECRSKNMRL
eukprot:UN25387